MTVAKRRRLAWALALFVLLAVGVTSYPYLRFERRTTPHTIPFGTVYWVADRWSSSEALGPEEKDPTTALPFATLPEGGGLLRGGACSEHVVMRITRPDGAFEVVLADPSGFTAARFGPDGSVQELRGLFTELDPTTASPELIRRLRTAEPKWPWWTKLPGFRKHLNP